LAGLEPAGHSPTPLRPRGWRRLHLTFHLLFIGAIVGLIGLAVWTDVRGYEQARVAIAAQVRYSSELFLKELESPDGRVVLANLDFRSEAHDLRPTLSSGRTRVMRAAMPDDYIIGRACYLVFQLPAQEALTACAAVDRSTSAVSRPGRYLYVIVRLISDRIAPHLKAGAPLGAGDHFRLEVLRSDGRRQRWVLVLDTFSSQALLDAQGYARDERVDPESYQVTAYAADGNWAVSPDASRHPDHHVRGSFVSSLAPARDRMLSVAVDMTGLTSPAEPWPVPSSSALVRIAHLYGNPVGTASVLRGATYEQQGAQLHDLVGTPLVSARSLYGSPGFGETLALYERPLQDPVWSDRFERDPKLGSDNVRWPLWRQRWLDDAPISVSSGLDPTGSYEVRSSIPAGVAVATWNRFAPKLALSFLAVLAVVIALYAVTMRAVLSRLMHLAAAAARSTHDSGGRAALPYEAAGDELGLLSRTLSGLIAKVRDDAARQERETQERVRREYQTLRVIGHHIRSPIQALLALNPPQSRSWPYIDRINKAVQAVFGGDALRDAFSRMYGEAVRVDLAEFLAQLAANAAQIGVHDVNFRAGGGPVPVDVDDGALSDTIVQILNNASRYRQPGTVITVTLHSAGGKAVITIANRGPTIPESELENIFEFGVSLRPASAENQGQGLYVARELVARMNGTITARNLGDGVAIDITLPVARDGGAPQ